MNIIGFIFKCDWHLARWCTHQTNDKGEYKYWKAIDSAIDSENTSRTKLWRGFDFEIQLREGIWIWIGIRIRFLSFCRFGLSSSSSFLSLSVSYRLFPSLSFSLFLISTLHSNARNYQENWNAIITHKKLSSNLHLTSPMRWTNILINPSMTCHIIFHMAIFSFHSFVVDSFCILYKGSGMVRALHMNWCV